MAWNQGISDVLNKWAEMGVFNYAIPFLLIFAVVFGILQKSGLFGRENKGINAIIALAIGLLALQFDFVTSFYQTIFPRFGVGLAVFLALIIFLGFFYPSDEEGNVSGAVKWIGWAVGIGIVIWALSSWNFWAENYNIGLWLEEYFWSLVIIAALIGLVIWAVKSGGGKKKP